MIAGYTLLKELKNNPAIYRQTGRKRRIYSAGWAGARCLAAWGQPYIINQLGSMISVHFSDHPVTDFSSASGASNDKFKVFFHAMLRRGVYLPPSAFESWFLNNALSYADLDETIRIAAESSKGIS